MNRDEMIKKQEEMLNLIKAENRDFSEDEKAEFENLTKQIDELPKVEEKSSEEEIKKALEVKKVERSEIIELCKTYNVEPTDYIEKSISEVKDMLIEKLAKENAPVATKNVDVEAIKSEADKVRDGIVDAIIYAGIHKGEANEYNKRGLKGIIDDCLEQDGEDYKRLRNMSVDEKIDKLQKTFFNPTASFPSIIDNVGKKAIKDIYEEKQTTFQEWVTEGSVNDFKTTPDHDYVMGGGKFEKVPEGGELKQSILNTELLPQRKIGTYGTQFTMTREAIYNDDIGFIANMPRKYALEALRTIDMQVYEMLMNNGAIFDGVSLFHANHGNLISTGAVPSETSFNDLEVLMSDQKDQFGKPIVVTMNTIIIPAEYKMAVYKVLNSTQTPGTNNNDANMFFGGNYKVIVTPYIKYFAGANAKSWFVVSNPSQAKSIQVDYLRGQKTPTFRRSEETGRLGFVWDIYMDWGITPVDFRGIYKHEGV